MLVLLRGRTIAEPLPAVALPADSDMVVVGAGITGIVAAIELARSGRSVTIIEANRVGGGATAGSLGVLSTPAAGAGFGDPNARLLLVGLAPGAHGANRTGRAFTGDGSFMMNPQVLIDGGPQDQTENERRQRKAPLSKSIADRPRDAKNQ